MGVDTNEDRDYSTHSLYGQSHDTTLMITTTRATSSMMPNTNENKLGQEGYLQKGLN